MNPLGLLQNAVNGLMQLDTAFPALLEKIAGKVIAIEMPDTDGIVYVLVDENGLRFTGSCSVPVDVTIRATLLQLLAYAAGRDDSPDGRLELSGEVSVAQELQRILGKLNLDWEEALSRWTGDIAARKLGNLTRAAAGYCNDAARSLALDLSEYLRFERRLTPDHSEVNEFTTSIEALRDDVERMKIRLDRVAHRINPER